MGVRLETYWIRLEQKQNIRETQKIPIFRLVTVVFVLDFLVILIVQLSSDPPINIMGQTSTTATTSTSSFPNNNIVSTRGHYDYDATGELIPEHNMTGYSYYNDVTDNSINKIQTEIMCPPQKEIAIYIHGAWTDETSVEEQLNRTAMSLAINNYTIPLIGFSWDSNTPFNEELQKS
jgi:hypothetical protein